MNVIYAIINKSNGMLYVGQSTNFENRKKDYLLNRHVYQQKIYRATEKYGWDNFSFEIIESDIEHCSLNNREKYWIKHLCSVEFGYNLTYGGGGATVSEEVKEAMSKRVKGENHPMFGLKGNANPNFGSKRKVPKLTGPCNPMWGKKGSLSPNFGKKRSEETKMRNKLAQKSRQIKVRCVETGKIYESISDAARDLNTGKQHISEFLQGKVKSVKGFTFERVL